MAQERRYHDDQEMVRFTNNYKFVRMTTSESVVRSATSAAALDELEDQVEVCVAFSHFSYEHSKKYLPVCDLQGIVTKDVKKGGRPMLLLTDPAIHCPTAKRFGTTNLQMRGVEAFFKTHRCNRLCKALGLKSREPAKVDE